MVIIADQGLMAGERIREGGGAMRCEARGERRSGWSRVQGSRF